MLILEHDTDQRTIAIIDHDRVQIRYQRRFSGAWGDWRTSCTLTWDQIAMIVEAIPPDPK